MIRIFVSAPYASASAVLAVHEHLTQMGALPTSSWAELATGPESLGEMPIEKVRAIAAQNDKDVGASNMVIALPMHREGGEMFAEVERARLAGKAIVWVGERKTLSAYREGVQRVATIEEAYRIVEEAL